MERNGAGLVIGMVLGTLTFSAPHSARAEVFQHFGTCDASAAVAVGPTMFIVANDEENQLRVYRRGISGKPLPVYESQNRSKSVSLVDLTAFLQLDPKHPEADIEGGARVGDRVYWITSHGRNSKGKPRPNRQRLFATEVKHAKDHVTIAFVGKPYKSLMKDLANSPNLKDYELARAAEKPPEEQYGLNIEGLAATPQGTLLIGFRNPIPHGKALIVPIENPQDVVNDKKARIGKPILLALGGLGIRSMEYVEEKGKYLIVAGPYDDHGEFRLYEWAGLPTTDVVLVNEVKFDDLHPEALFSYPGAAGTIQILSDDGSKEVNGKECKDDAVPREKKYFRSVETKP